MFCCNVITIYSENQIKHLHARCKQTVELLLTACYLNIEAQFFNPVIISVDNYKAVHIRLRYLADEGNDNLRNRGKYLPVNKAQIFSIFESSGTPF